MATFSLPATSCPPLVTPVSLLRPGTDTAPSAKKITNGDTTAGTDNFNENAARLDVTGRRGGGAYAVTEGLDLSAAALVCTVTAGQAMLDGPATSAGGTVTLADNAYNWIWVLQTGALTKTSSATTTPPAAPSAACAFLGRIQVTAGTPGTPDYSGRWELRNGTLWRRTGDAGIPGDSSASTLLFVTVTAGGSYLWNGLAYVRLAANAPVDAQYLVLATNSELTVERVLTPGPSLQGTDGGAGSTYTLDVKGNAGTPEGVVTAAVGTLCRDTTNGEVYVKNSGAGNTGWIKLHRLTGDTDLAVADGGTGASTASAARGNLGVPAATDVLSKVVDDALADGVDIGVGTTTGSKIGTANTQKLAFFGATPVVQPAALADTSGATLAALEAEVNALKAIIRSLGLLAP